MSAPAETGTPAAVVSRLRGRSFVNPLFDYMLIGGGLSLVVVAYLRLVPGGESLATIETLPYFLLLGNSAHFASSTVRLYTKPGAKQEWPFLTMGFPLVMLAVVALFVIESDRIGSHFFAVYLTWSPYHYAAQAYGLSVMFAFRAGCRMSEHHKRLFYWACMPPFVVAFLTGYGNGLHWLLPPSVYELPLVTELRSSLTWLYVVSFAAPALAYAAVWRSASGPMPLISLLLPVANAIWWLLLRADEAFAWVTIFHAVQYLAIVMIFHVRDQMALPENTHGAAYHYMRFYALSLLLAYALFYLLPRGYAWAGLGLAQSTLIVLAAINIHHFVVDGFIWRLRRDKSNRRIAESTA